MFFHGASLDFQQTLQAAGLLRGFHLFISTTRTQERVYFSLRQTLIGLADRFDKGRECRARGSGKPVPETGQIARRVEESRKAVSRREGHERRWQALADSAHLLGIARVDEQHVGARFVKRFGSAQSLVEVVDPS